MFNWMAAVKGVVTIAVATKLTIRHKDFCAGTVREQSLA